MAKTVINVSAIINSSSKANSGRSKIIIAEDGISTVRSKVDSKIMKRNNIKARLKNVQNLVEQIGDDVAKISTAINNGALEYQSTEKRIKSMVQDLRGTRSQKGSIKEVKYIVQALRKERKVLH